MTESLDKIVPKITNKEDLENKYGILLRHVEQIKRYNKRLNWIIMLRPINKDIADKLKDGYNDAYERNQAMKSRAEMMQAWADYCYSKCEEEPNDKR